MSIRGWLSTHVLDMANGCPASGIAARLFVRNGAERKLVADALTNHDGRTDEPLLDQDAIAPGWYELEFDTGRCFIAHGADAD